MIPSEFGKNFILIEETSEINNYLNAIDLLCLTSKSGEGMSNIIMEAMSVGVSYYQVILVIIKNYLVLMENYLQLIMMKNL